MPFIKKNQGRYYVTETTVRAKRFIVIISSINKFQWFD